MFSFIPQIRADDVWLLEQINKTLLELRLIVLWNEIAIFIN